MSMDFSDTITVAIPKGRLLDEITGFLREAGFKVSFSGRELIAMDRANDLRFMLVKNADLPIYVSRGIAGLGICGDDVLFETKSPVYRLFKFPFGRTKMCIAARRGEKDVLERGTQPLKIATKFPRFTESYFHSIGIPVEIIKLSGSIELAPVLGLTDLIVDLVQTGRTLAENNLEIIEELASINVYLISNPAYYKLNYKRVEDFVKGLKSVEYRKAYRG